MPIVMRRRWWERRRVYSRKAHPADQSRKEPIHRVHGARDELKGDVSIAYLGNYDRSIARLMTSGVDLWLNTPRPPVEASGTSGMKAAVNGVPSLSVLVGWWLEGCIEGVTGWPVGDGVDPSDDSAAADSLYSALEEKILPMFYGPPERVANVTCTRSRSTAPSSPAFRFSMPAVRFR